MTNQEIIKDWLKRRKMLELWKDGKREKWLNEGRTKKEIEKQLKDYKVKWSPLLKKLFKNIWQ